MEIKNDLGVFQLFQMFIKNFPNFRSYRFLIIPLVFIEGLLVHICTPFQTLGVIDNAETIPIDTLERPKLREERRMKKKDKLQKIRKGRCSEVSEVYLEGKPQDYLTPEPSVGVLCSESQKKSLYFDKEQKLCYLEVNW